MLLVQEMRPGGPSSPPVHQGKPPTTKVSSPSASKVKEQRFIGGAHAKSQTLSGGRASGSKNGATKSEENKPGPSTRLSGLMKRIQATASGCQNQFETFVNNVSSVVSSKKPPKGESHHARHSSQRPLSASLSCPPVENPNMRQYLFPGPAPPPPPLSPEVRKSQNVSSIISPLAVRKMRVENSPLIDQRVRQFTPHPLYPTPVLGRPCPDRIRGHSPVRRIVPPHQSASEAYGRSGEGLFDDDEGLDGDGAVAAVAVDEKRPKVRGWYMVKTTSCGMTPASLSNGRRPAEIPTPDPFRTWNAPPKTRPDLQGIGFRPTDSKHVTCIEVTLVTNGQQRATEDVEDGVTATDPSLDGQEESSEPSKSKAVESSDPPEEDVASKRQNADDGISADGICKSKPPMASPSTSSMPTYCFGENVTAGTESGEQKSPCGTLSSRSSSRGSEQFDSGFEEIGKKGGGSSCTTPSPTTTLTQSSSPWKFRNMLDLLSGNKKDKPPTGDAPIKSDRTPKVKAKRSTIRREKAFRERNKKAWSRAKELERDRTELFDRFSRIRQRLGEDDADIDQHPHGGPKETDLVSDALGLNAGSASPSLVKTLVRQYNTVVHTGLEHRSREKIVPSRLNSKRCNNPNAPCRPPRGIHASKVHSLTRLTPAGNEPA